MDTSESSVEHNTDAGESKTNEELNHYIAYLRTEEGEEKFKQMQVAVKARDSVTLLEIMAEGREEWARRAAEAAREDRE